MSGFIEAEAAAQHYAEGWHKIVIQFTRRGIADRQLLYNLLINRLNQDMFSGPGETVPVCGTCGNEYGECICSGRIDPIVNDPAPA